MRAHHGRPGDAPEPHPELMLPILTIEFYTTIRKPTKDMNLITRFIVQIKYNDKQSSLIGLIQV